MTMTKKPKPTGRSTAGSARKGIAEAPAPYPLPRIEHEPTPFIEPTVNAGRTNVPLWPRAKDADGRDTELHIFSRYVFVVQSPDRRYRVIAKLRGPRTWQCVYTGAATLKGLDLALAHAKRFAASDKVMPPGGPRDRLDEILDQPQFRASLPRVKRTNYSAAYALVGRHYD